MGEMGGLTGEGSHGGGNGWRIDRDGRKEGAEGVRELGWRQACELACSWLRADSPFWRKRLTPCSERGGG